MPSFVNNNSEEPEFFRLKLKKAPKPRDYDCPHHSGQGETLLKKLQSEEELGRGASEVRAKQSFNAMPQPEAEPEQEQHYEQEEEPQEQNYEEHEQDYELPQEQYEEEEQQADEEY